MKRYLWIFCGVLLVLVALLVAHLLRLNWGNLMVDVLDVGQGDALLITTPDQHHILIDGGPEQFVLEQLGEVLPFLYKEIDLVVLTHPHADHMMGLIQVLKRYKVKAVLFSGLNTFSPMYDEFLREVRVQGIPLYTAQADEDWRFGL